MSSRARLVLLVALCSGALLVGVELMITAVALPRIVVDLADWGQLRRASWIVNGYLLAYIATMPLAGRAGDRFGIPRLFMGALGTFALGSVLSGAAPSIDLLILARILQGIGAGAILPLATAGASHLYAGPARARALGLVGACTFLGMALGPFLGASVLDWFELDAALDQARAGPLLHDLLTPAWRWVFYLGAPLAIVAISYVGAASPDWAPERDSGRLDAVGATLFTLSLSGGLIALTLLGETQPVAGLPVPWLAAAGSLVCGLLAARHMSRTDDPFIDPGLLRDRVFGAAILVSALTGYALATVIIGAAVYVDRVRYAGTGEQRVVLGTLALSMAVGALGSGFLLRRMGVVTLSLAGLAAAIGGLVMLGTCSPATPLEVVLLGLALFGLGFGLTVTPRSTAAVEALGRRAFGMASAGVTVARMAGMAVGLAVLTGFGTTRIESLSVVLADRAARDAVLPPGLQGRPLEDVRVVGALEAWAAGQAAEILGGLFLAAALVTAAAIVPTLLMGDAHGRAGRATIQRHELGDGGDGDDRGQPALTL